MKILKKLTLLLIVTSLGASSSLEVEKDEHEAGRHSFRNSAIGMGVVTSLGVLTYLLWPTKTEIDLNNITGHRSFDTQDNCGYGRICPPGYDPNHDPS